VVRRRSALRSLGFDPLHSAGIVDREVLDQGSEPVALFGIEFERKFVEIS
jgi:hypothetical protein